MKTVAFTFLLIVSQHAFGVEQLLCDGSLDLQSTPPSCTGTWIAESVDVSVLDITDVQNLASAALSLLGVAFAYRFVVRFVLR